MDAVPEPAESDSRDWTFVLHEPCRECGYTPHDPTLTAYRMESLVPRWAAVLRRTDVAERPAPHVWSALEYACHSRDLIGVLGERVNAMITVDNPVFADYDGEGEAVRSQFWASDPAQVSRQIAERTASTVTVLDAVDDWQRTGNRSDGRPFTVTELCRYLLHDIEHHLHDVHG